jgi:hypothetical protein
VQHKRHAQHPQREAFLRSRYWKSDELSVYNAGMFWLVKSKHVHIQARYWSNKTHPSFTSLGAVAVSGPFINNNTLIFHTLHGATSWNGQEILAYLPSKFENEYVKARYTFDSQLIRNGNKAQGIEVELPDGVSLIVNRWRQSLSVMISMRQQEGGQSGQCGNFNLETADDTFDSMRDIDRLQPEKAINGGNW